MKGVTILNDEKKKRKILQVDIKEVAKNPNDFEDLIDVLIAESRKDEKKISWEAAKKQLKKAGKYKSTCICLFYVRFFEYQLLLFHLLLNKLPDNLQNEFYINLLNFLLVFLHQRVLDF